MFLATALLSCVLATPAPFDPQPGVHSPWFPGGAANSLAVSPGNRRLVIRYAYGFGLYDLVGDGKPEFRTAWKSPYERKGDGQYTVSKIAASEDGARVLVGQVSSGHGTLVLAIDKYRPTLALAAEFPPSWSGTSGALVVDSPVKGRYVAYSIETSGLYAADLSDLPPNGLRLPVLPSQRVAGAPVTSGISSGAISVLGSGRRVLVYSVGATIVVVDVTRPGTGARVAEGLRVLKTLRSEDVGLDEGFPVRHLASGVHPGGDLLLFVEGTSTQDPNSRGAVLLRSADGETFAQVGARFLPSAPFDVPTFSSTAVSTEDDLLILLWEGAEGESEARKLYTLSVNDWATDPGIESDTDGNRPTPRVPTDLTPEAVVEPEVVPDFRPLETKAFREGQEIRVYIAGGRTSHATNLSCAPPPAEDPPASE